MLAHLKTKANFSGVKSWREKSTRAWAWKGSCQVRIVPPSIKHWILGVKKPVKRNLLWGTDRARGSRRVLVQFGQWPKKWLWRHQPWLNLSCSSEKLGRRATLSALHALERWIYFSDHLVFYELNIWITFHRCVFLHRIVIISGPWSCVWRSSAGIWRRGEGEEKGEGKEGKSAKQTEKEPVHCFINQKSEMEKFLGTWVRFDICSSMHCNV